MWNYTLRPRAWNMVRRRGKNGSSVAVLLCDRMESSLGVIHSSCTATLPGNGSPNCLRINALRDEMRKHPCSAAIYRVQLRLFPCTRNSKVSGLSLELRIAFRTARFAKTVCFSLAKSSTRTSTGFPTLNNAIFRSSGDHYSAATTPPSSNVSEGLSRISFSPGCSE